MKTMWAYVSINMNESFSPARKAKMESNEWSGSKIGGQVRTGRVHSTGDWPSLAYWGRSVRAQTVGNKMNKKLHNSIRRRGETKNWIKVGGWPKKQQVKGSYKKGRQGARLQQMNFHIRRADVRHARDPLCREQLLLLARWIRFSQVTSIPGNFFNFLLETLIWRKLNEMKLSAS